MPDTDQAPPNYPAWAKGMTDAELAVSLEHYTGQLSAFGEAVAALRGELESRYAGDLNFALAKSGKEHGKAVTDMNTPGYQVEGEKKRTITWDSGKLLGLALSMPADDAKAKLKITVTCPDRTYKDATGEFRAKLEAARTERVAATWAVNLVRIGPDSTTENTTT